MNYALIFSFLLFIGPPLAVIAVMLIGDIVNSLFYKLFPMHPYCDIDPRNHPAYCNGWIGNVRVRK